MIHFSLPLEAIHRDTGAIASVVAATGRTRGLIREIAIGSGVRVWVDANGLDADWRIRNVATSAERTDIAMVATPKYPDALVERLVGLVNAVAVYDIKPPSINGGSYSSSRIFQGQARAIIAELPAEVDADRMAAKTIAQEHGLVKVNWSHNNQCEQAILAAIKRGRALEREHADEGRGR